MRSLESSTKQQECSLITCVSYVVVDLKKQLSEAGFTEGGSSKFKKTVSGLNENTCALADNYFLEGGI